MLRERDRLECRVYKRIRLPTDVYVIGNVPRVALHENDFGYN